MNTKRGFKLKLEGLKEFSSFLDDFRNDATKVLARKWTTDVALRAVETCDFASLGLSKAMDDHVRAACDDLNSRLAAADQTLHAYNCALEFYFVESVVLAVFAHGDKDYQEAFRKKRVVEHWGWGADVARPAAINEKNWQIRERVWTTLAKRSRFANNLSFQLLSGALPVVSATKVLTLLPTYETRVQNGAAAILAQEGKKLRSVSDIELQRLKDDVARKLTPELTRDHFMGKNQVAAPPKVVVQKLASPVTERKVSAPKKKDPEPGGFSSIIDHADVILASDGRTFIAVPNVGLADNSRVFIHVGSKQVVFIQDGVNFGTVADISEAAREHLKFCKEAILVEVDKSGDGRLLRARYVAIVTDISFTENQRTAILGFKRPTRSSAASREMEEWEKTSRSQ